MSPSSTPPVARIEIETPTQDEIVAILKKHPLIRLKEPVQRAFLVGSFAGGRAGQPHADSDVDILLEVAPRAGMSSDELAEHYRQALRRHFMKHGIRGRMDSVHPQWSGRRVDVYFTYDADAESRPKVRLHPKPAFASMAYLRKREDVEATEVMRLASLCVGLKRGHAISRRRLELLAAKRRIGTLRLFGQMPVLEVLSSKAMFLLASEIVLQLGRQSVAPGITKTVDSLSVLVRLPESERVQVFCRCFLDVLRHAPHDASERASLVEAAVAPRSDGMPFLAELLDYVEDSGAMTEHLLKELELELLTPRGRSITCPAAQALFTHARMRLQIREAVGSGAPEASAPTAPRRRLEL